MSCLFFVQVSSFSYIFLGTAQADLIYIAKKALLILQNLTPKVQKRHFAETRNWTLLSLVKSST